VAKITANLRIRIDQVHLRLEHGQTAVGVRLRNFSLQTTNASGEATKLDKIPALLFKVPNLYIFVFRF
jgi:hypothetical protein